MTKRYFLMAVDDTNRRICLNYGTHRWTVDHMEHVMASYLGNCLGLSRHYLTPQEQDYTNQLISAWLLMDWTVPPTPVHHTAWDDQRTIIGFEFWTSNGYRIWTRLTSQIYTCFPKFPIIRR